MYESTELETQQKIYRLITEHPGLSLSTIASILHIKEPIILYHVRNLIKHELIMVIREKGFTRCYVKGTVGTKDKKLISILRQEIPLKIVLYLLKYPNSRHKEILEHFHLAKSTLSYHINNLTPVFGYRNIDLGFDNIF